MNLDEVIKRGYATIEEMQEIWDESLQRQITFMHTCKEHIWVNILKTPSFEEFMKNRSGTHEIYGMIINNALSTYPIYTYGLVVKLTIINGKEPTVRFDNHMFDIASIMTDKRNAEVEVREDRDNS